MLRDFTDILTALPITVLITLVAFAAGLIVGFFCALIKVNKVPLLTALVTFYTSFIRGTPLLVQIYISYYGLPVLTKAVFNMDISGVPAIVFVYVAYSINTGAYLTETIRGAIEAVDRGQTEAALSIGMTDGQAIRRIVIPQAFLVALPNLGNTVIALVKDTSLAFSVTVVDLLGKSRLLGANSFRYFEVYLNAAFIYWITCIALEFAVKKLEIAFKKKRGLEI